ncbi:MAG: sulfatase-like hydrolase/transferase [Acidobacteria bacterium]|nr:sulfatase-like hydrolase/transferase [Acidobacteriota bacterium]
MRGLFLFLLLCVGAAAAERPNIIVILADDMGFSDIGCYGGEVRTPNIDALAEGGVRFRQFYNAGRCCPTRASLLTGLYAHQAGIGHMTNEQDFRFDQGYGAYSGQLNRHCVTIAEALEPAGYRTLMAGKWHVGTYEGMWPVDRGFDRYFGIIRGAANFFRPAPDKLLTLDRERAIPGAGFYATDAFTDHAIEFVEESDDLDDDQPFFLYLAYTSPHWPLHAWPDDVAKYRGKYLQGWEALRQSRFARMREIGLLDGAWELTEPNSLPWDILPESLRDEMDHRMAVYAAMIDRMDQNIGRLVEALRQREELDDTLILFLSDNGGCAEGGMIGRGPASNMVTGEGYSHSYGQSWANASNTPFRRFKHWVDEGGIASPLVAQWPAAIEGGGRWIDEPAHLIDLMATAIDVSGAKYPKFYGGQEIQPYEGKSLRPAFAGRPIDREAIYWEHEGNRAVRMGKWKLVAMHGEAWRLHDMTADRTEMHDVGAANPAIRKKMIGMYEAWAARVGVLPWPVERKKGYQPPKLRYPTMADY